MTRLRPLALHQLQTSPPLTLFAFCFFFSEPSTSSAKRTFLTLSVDDLSKEPLKNLNIFPCAPLEKALHEFRHQDYSKYRQIFAHYLEGATSPHWQ